MNLRAWLKSPHLGMISILTAGDKHFFRHLQTIQQQTGIGLNLWGINPLEVTHFKAGFLGVPPDFQEKRVYSHGGMKQLRYQSLRFRRCCTALGTSTVPVGHPLWRVLPQFRREDDYFHIFDYWRWNEQQIDETLAPVRLGARSRHKDHLAYRRRHGGLLQLRLLHRRRLHRARHLPQQPDPRRGSHSRGSA